MNEDKVGVYEFGRQLIASRDLDPVYVVLHQAQFDHITLRKWLLAYWCFYHCGTASWVAEQPDYWAAMYVAARSKDYPRSSERRHFRADNALESIDYLEGRGIDDLLNPLENMTLPVASVISHVQSWVGFGPWISFKVADMLERLGLANVQFDRASALLFDSPREACRLMWRRYSQGPHEPECVEEWAVNVILACLGKELAPPRYERPINVQEVETILCKWKAYLSGHYEIGKDTREVREGLLRFARVKLAQRLLRAGEEARLW